jgi:uncharacterized ion transporter superfamily protein YfcC
MTVRVAGRDGDIRDGLPGRKVGVLSMGPWLLLLILAVIAFILGFTGIGYWLFVIAAILLIAGLIVGAMGGWGRGSRTRI